MELFVSLGILAVFLPIGLGAAAIGKFFNQYHNAVFDIGGTSLTILGIVILTGKHFSLPFQLGGKEISIAVSEALSGITFLAMGVLILYLARRSPD